MAAAAAVAAAAIVTLKNHSPEPKHDEVAAYITSVDAVQFRMQAQLTKTVTAYKDFSKGHKSAQELQPQLDGAEQTLRTLRVRLVSLAAPPPARHLRALLVRLADYEVGTAHDIDGLARYSPRLASLLARAKAAGDSLTLALGKVKPPQAHTIHGTKAQVRAAQAAFTTAATTAAAQQADAIEAYDAQIAGVVRGFRELDPPAVMRPSYRSQLAALESSRAAGSKLAAALRGSHRSEVPVLGARFGNAARAASSVSAQEAQIAAVKAYDHRVRAIGTVQGEISRELSRLQSLRG